MKQAVRDKFGVVHYPLFLWRDPYPRNTRQYRYLRCRSGDTTPVEQADEEDVTCIDCVVLGQTQQRSPWR